VKGGLSFDDLLQRIHPAASRVARLSKETPAHFIVFDLLVDEAGKPIHELHSASVAQTRELRKEEPAKESEHRALT